MTGFVAKGVCGRHGRPDGGEASRQARGEAGVPRTGRRAPGSSRARAGLEDVVREL